MKKLERGRETNCVFVPLRLVVVFSTVCVYLGCAVNKLPGPVLARLNLTRSPLDYVLHLRERMSYRADSLVNHELDESTDQSPINTTNYENPFSP